MSDLVERLREGEPCDYSNDRCKVRNAESACLCAIAADEIKRLRAEVERLGRDYETARDAHDRRVRELDAHCVEVATLRAANARLRGAINTALRQLADGNRVLATDTLARAVPTGGRSKP